MGNFFTILFTGIAIVIQLNQHPYQPRERDYAYVGSFFAFSIWTGLGTFAFLQLIKNNLYDFLKIEFVKSNLKKILSFTSILLLGIPTLMAYENWDDHDRSNRFTARDFAKIICHPVSLMQFYLLWEIMTLFLYGMYKK